MFTYLLLKLSFVRGPVSSALQSVCKAYPTLAKEHLISPTLVELETSPSRAWLLATLAATPSLAAAVLPALISIVQQLASSSSLDCDGTALAQHYWDKLLPVSSVLPDVIQSNPGAAPLALPSLNSLVLLSQQTAATHWKCCNAKVNRFIENISASISYNARHATDR